MITAADRAKALSRYKTVRIDTGDHKSEFTRKPAPYRGTTGPVANSPAPLPAAEARPTQYKRIGGKRGAGEVASG